MNNDTSKVLNMKIPLKYSLCFTKYYYYFDIFFCYTKNIILEFKCDLYLF